MKNAIILSMLTVSAGMSSGQTYIEVFGDEPGQRPAPRLDYFSFNSGDAENLEIDVTGDNQVDIAFQIFTDGNDTSLAMLDFTRTGGMIGRFDDEDNFVMDTFELGDTLGAADEDRVGFETLAFAAYDFNGSAPVDALLNQTFWVGFGLFDADEDRFRYGFANISIGGFVTPTFMQLNAVVYGNAIDSDLVLQIPSPASAALLPIALAMAGRRR